MKIKLNERKYNAALDTGVIITNKTDQIKPGQKILLETDTRMSQVKVDKVIPSDEKEVGLRVSFGIVTIKSE